MPHLGNNSGYHIYKESGEELTDWEDDLESCDEDEEIQSENVDQISDSFTVYYERRNTFIRPTLEQAKQQLINRLTQEFWSAFHNQKHGAVQEHDLVNDMVEALNGCPEERFGSNINRKRGHEDDGARSCPCHINDSRGHKRLKATPSVSEFSEISKFACPYRKHDPRKYGVPNWGPCALTPLQTVARVKAHLYRHHRVHQCQRCKGVFNTQEDLDTHVEAFEGCEAKVGQPVDGVTGKIKERLQTRKKAYPGQTEADRWGEVYQILFPNEEVPSPYFEPIRDYHGDDILAPDSREVVNYEDYLRRELPNFFKNTLESAVSYELEPIEERLRGQMLSLLEVAQKLAFSKYRSMMGHAADGSPNSGLGDDGINLLAAKQTPIPQDESQNSSKETYQPLNPPPISGLEYLLSFSDFNASKAPELQHASLDTTEQAAASAEKGTALEWTESNRAMDSGSESPSSSEPTISTDGPLPSSNPKLFCNNLETSSNNESPYCVPFTEEWALNMDKLDQGVFNWCPSWDITSTEDGAGMP